MATIARSCGRVSHLLYGTNNCWNRQEYAHSGQCSNSKARPLAPLPSLDYPVVALTARGRLFSELFLLLARTFNRSRRPSHRSDNCTENNYFSHIYSDAGTDGGGSFTNAQKYANSCKAAGNCPYCSSHLAPYSATNYFADASPDTVAYPQSLPNNRWRP